MNNTTNLNSTKESFSINKYLGFIVSVVLTGLGLLALMAPVYFGIGLSYIITAGLGIHGAVNILSYIRVSPDERDGWTLASGIMFLLLSAIIILSAIDNSPTPVLMLMALTFTIGFLVLLNGIDQIHAFLTLHRADIPGAGWILASGILNVLLAALILINPVLGWLSMSIVWGIYLTITGIALFVESCAGRRGKHPNVHTAV